MKFTLDTQLGTLLANPLARAIIDEHMPGASTHPMISLVRGMTLGQLLSLPQAAQMGLTKEKVEKLLAEVNQNIT